MHQKKIIVAMDGVSKERALEVTRSIADLIWGVKLTDLLFDGCDAIAEFKRHCNVFADAKLHDIPHTVACEVARLAGAGADLITVHTSGGETMMKRAKEFAGASKILGVTVLTSEGGDVKDRVMYLAREAQRACLDGIVCSGREVVLVAGDTLLAPMLKVVPGIRPTWYRATDDQSRTVTPKEALTRGADLLVLGRVIMESSSPREAVEKVLQEIA